ncbi:hypothetical protein HRG_004126 [Hirsutella rhossiliensis]|uniref:Uncharacterized protein n=1 Tax=Hirsutella rhossiliensis TaxID=111463 RepID=A0A9P8SLT1_9HYPO|nr:uncharacterized protein HRG_04126 [Hirsutella rhossiliensis]KAH0966110.1 hypothetical protein HRG_04126 [Hirsutella rhossiliensis]
MVRRNICEREMTGHFAEIAEELIEVTITGKSDGLAASGQEQRNARNEEASPQWKSVKILLEATEKVAFLTASNKSGKLPYSIIQHADELRVMGTEYLDMLHEETNLSVSKAAVDAGLRGGFPKKLASEVSSALDYLVFNLGTPRQLIEALAHVDYGLEAIGGGNSPQVKVGREALERVMVALGDQELKVLVHDWKTSHTSDCQQWVDTVVRAEKKRG